MSRRRRARAPLGPALVAGGVGTWLYLSASPAGSGGEVGVAGRF